MNRTKIKICGLRRPEDIAYVNEAGPDLAGFVFDPSRRRYITPEKAAGMRKNLSGKILAVGVFVDAPVMEVVRISKEVGLDFIQLHGSEDAAYMKELKKMTPLPLIDARKVQSSEDVKEALLSPADLILLDNGPGGTGICFDWSLVENVPADFILAGGISRDNVKEAIERCRPWAVDVSSSLETDGYKDLDKIREFMKAAAEAAGRSLSDNRS